MKKSGMKGGIWAVCFTKTGACLLEKVICRLGLTGIAVEGFYKIREGLDKPGILQPVEDSMAAWMGKAFQEADGILVIGAAGIAVRSAAPWIRDKFTDPALVVMDEKGRFVIPLLSGHVGGGNELGKLLAACTGASLAITTATDVEQRFAVDVFAVKRGLWISSRQRAKEISADVLAGRPVGIFCAFPQRGEIPGELNRICGENDLEEFRGKHLIYLGVKRCRKWERALEEKGGGILYLVPPVLVLGVGCRKATDSAWVKNQIISCLQAEDIWLEAVKTAATIHRKLEEPALRKLCEEMNWELKGYAAQELSAVPGTFSDSPFVEQTVGVGNVCERAAVLGSEGGELILPKQRLQGVTAAVASKGWILDWKEEVEADRWKDYTHM